MPGKVLLASRLPEEADATAHAADRLATALGAELMLVYVAVELETAGRVHATTGEEPESLRKRMIDELTARAQRFLDRHVPGKGTGVWLVEGDVAEQITRIAREQAVDYLVIGTEGRSTLSRIVLGSTSQKILQSAPCPVLVVPARSR